MIMLKSHFSVNDSGHLVIGGVDAIELARRFGTPLYVVDEQRVRENYRRFYKAFASRWGKVRVFYALKANSNLAICKILQGEGAGAEVSSGNELQNALRSGFRGGQIVFNGNHKTEKELEMAITNDVLINVDSFQELAVVGKIASKLGKDARIGFRVNPDVRAPTHPYIATGLRESKFGFEVASGQALEAYLTAKNMKNVEVVGIHCHIGSQILETAPFEEEAEKVMELVVQIKEKLGLDIELIDLGGGLGIPYKPDDRPVSPDQLAERVVPIIEQVVKERGLKPPTIAFEPGRYIIADASVLLVRAGYIKQRSGLPDWVAVDAGMNALIRPALYGAYHHIEVANKMLAKNEKLVNVAGPLCESGDFLGKERMLPKVEPGDILVVFDVGAYGLAMSNQHTAQPRPAMVLVNSGRAEIIRERETYEDLTRLDRIPEWLK
jgi:diaminopimelate decarboxylase